MFSGFYYDLFVDNQKRQMILKIINSNSYGNCYILENNEEALIIEAGVKIIEVKKTLNFDLSKVVGAIITHEHSDHSKGLKEFLNNGIKCYSSKGTFESLNIKHHNAKIIQSKKQYQIGNFKIIPFDIHHDVAEPFGFLIYHIDCGKVIFLTDTYYTNYKFPKDINNIIIEANYSLDILKEKFGEENLEKIFLKDRILESHMSIETCRDTLLANDLSQVNNIVLIHLSNDHSDENLFEKIIRDSTGINPFIAHKNQILEFNKIPF